VYSPCGIAKISKNLYTYCDFLFVGAGLPALTAAVTIFEDGHFVLIPLDQPGNVLLVGNTTSRATAMANPR
jgi:hypothetical protein